MKKCLIVVSMFVVISGCILVIRGWGQQPAPSFLQPTPSLVPTYDSSTGTTVYSVQGSNNPARSEIHQLMKALNNADGEAAKADITKRLETAVVKFFDEDMKARETELTKIEERLKKLTDQLDRRRKAKNEIIQLQLKVLINDAEGLGFGSAAGFESLPSPAAFPGAGGVRYFAVPPTPVPESAKDSESPRALPARPGSSKK